MNRNHLKQKNTTYFRHLKQAWKEAMCCGLAADLLFVCLLYTSPSPRDS